METKKPRRGALVDVFLRGAENAYWRTLDAVIDDGGDEAATSIGD